MERYTHVLNVRMNADDDDFLVMKDDVNKAFNKLGRLERIERELGVSLEVLFKALKDGAYFKTDYYGIDITYHILEEHEIRLKRNLFDIRKENLLNNKPYYTGGFIFYWKDYGETWALTKEELENAKD